MQNSFDPRSTHDFLRALVSAPSADNAQPWQIEREAGYLNCRYSPRSGLKDIFGVNGHATLISAGALLENLERLAHHHPDVKFAWHDKQAGWSLEWPETLCLDADQHELAKVTKRHTNRHPFRRHIGTPLPVFNLPENNGSIVTLTDRDAISRLSQALLLCSQARFNDPELHQWLFSSLKWNETEAAQGHGLDISTLHLPPGGKLFMRAMSSWKTMRWMNKLGIYHLLALADTMPFRLAPCVIAICGPKDKQAVIDAGRTMQHLWIELNHHGLAVHPYYAVTDLCNRLHANQLETGWRKPVSSAAAIAEDVLNLPPDHMVHMLLRVGTPTVTNPVRSQRLPLSQFILDT